MEGVLGVGELHFLAPYWRDAWGLSKVPLRSGGKWAATPLEVPYLKILLRSAHALLLFSRHQPTAPMNRNSLTMKQPSSQSTLLTKSIWYSTPELETSFFFRYKLRVVGTPTTRKLSRKKKDSRSTSAANCWTQKRSIPPAISRPATPMASFIVRRLKGKNMLRGDRPILITCFSFACINKRITLNASMHLFKFKEIFL